MLLDNALNFIPNEEAKLHSDQGQFRVKWNYEVKF